VHGLDLLVGVAPHAAAAGPRVDPVKEVPKGPKLGILFPVEVHFELAPHDGVTPEEFPGLQEVAVVS